MKAEVRRKSKSKMITFRLTADEYEKCLKHCFDHCIGSVSSLARTAIHLHLQQPEQAHSRSLETRVSDVENRIQMILHQLNRLRHGMASVPSHEENVVDEQPLVQPGDAGAQGL